jgi:hypothetical protein
MYHVILSSDEEKTRQLTNPARFYYTSYKLWHQFQMILTVVFGTLKINAWAAKCMMCSRTFQEMKYLWNNPGSVAIFIVYSITLQ